MPRHLELALVVVVIGHFEPLEVEMQRLARQQAPMAGIPVVELDELGIVELGPHQFALHRLLGAPRCIAGEAIILIIEPGDLALHPVIELRVGELSPQERLHILRLLDLCLDVLIFVICDLLRDQRGDDLPADRHQLPRGEIGLVHPLVRAPLVAGSARGDAGLVGFVRRSDLQHVPRELRGGGERLA